MLFNNFFKRIFSQKNPFFFFGFLLLVFLVQPTAVNANTLVTDPDELPAFPGCEAETDPAKRQQCTVEQLMAFVSSHLDYPATAKAAGKEGRAVVSFTVGVDGTIQAVTLVEDPGSGMGAEALRVVQQMPNWQPGTKDGQPVAVEMKLPVQFKLKATDKQVALQEVDELPVFPGCAAGLEGDALRQCSNQQMAAFVSKNLVYPKAAAEAGIEGMVVVSFVIEKDGSVGAVRAVKEIGGGCSEEVMRVLYSMPSWQPGRKDGQIVRTELKLPVKFVAEQAEAMSQKTIQYDLQLTDYRLSPNPARAQIDLAFQGEKGDLQVRIMDTQGKVLFQEAIQDFAGFYQQQVDLSAAAAGLYFLQIRQQGRVFVDRFSVVD